ncbi:MAG TPA: GGDEF domain-containing phosphodiesterase, partial [Magnetospirillum sp.]|nr:GGDEF domain-containing phosphodiesterase [Magnetospirillum sp.]
LYAFSEPFSVAERDLYCSTSIGVALYPDDADTAEQLLSSADAAMYHCKAGGRTYSFYDNDMNRQAVERVNLENDLRHALAERQFRLHYQPKLDARSRRIVGAEALIRWSHPERGEVSPALFIPVAERAGLVGAIGDWALTEACRQMRKWCDDGLDFGCVSVNLSPAQFHDAGLSEKVERALALSKLPPSALELEITETMMATEVDRAISILTHLGAMGVRISIDDFGTGYSSLAYLKLFPVDTLKIDRAFVKELPGNAKDGAIVASIVALATNLGFDVIAEGVETPDQAVYLLGKGVSSMQGYLFSPPVGADRFTQLLRNGV